MQIIVTGGSGFIGSRLVGALAGYGHEVTILDRNPPQVTRAGVRYVPRDLLQQAVAPEILAEHEAVVHLAGVSIFRRWSKEYRALVYDSRIKTARNLIAAMTSLEASQCPRVVVSASAVGYYGDRRDEVLTEASEAGLGYLAKVCTDWEAVWRPLSARGVRVANIRTGIVMGAGGGLIGVLEPLFRKGLGAVAGDPHAYLSWIGLDDLVRVYRLAIEDDRVAGAINAVTPEAVTYRELSQTMGRVLRRPVLLRVPSPLLELALGEVAHEVLVSQRVAPAKLRRLGFTYRNPGLEEALRETLSPKR